MNNFYWAVWAILILKKEDYGRKNVFNFDFLDFRIQMHTMVKELYFEKQ